MAEIHGQDYASYPSLEQARPDPDSAVVLSGHYGGGGGLVVDGVWTHPGRLTGPVSAQAKEVVLGARFRIDGVLLRQEHDTELRRKRDWPATATAEELAMGLRHLTTRSPIS